MRVARLLALGIAGLWVAGCPKSKPAGEDAAADANANANANADPDAKADDKGVILGGGGAKGDASTSTSTSTSYAGKYSVALGAMYVPNNKDWSSVKFKNDETKMLGDGEMSIAIAPSGRVSGGTEGGPLGASVVEGMSSDGGLTATIRRKDPTDDGLTGTLVAKVTADAIEGTMKLAESNAAVVRIGKLDAKKK